MDLIRRGAWGAAASRGKSVAIPVPVASLFLHHSAGPDGGPETIRGIQRFHQDTRGWADIAYTWLYSPRDRVFYEGRGPGVAGAHTRGHNRTAHAVCILGNYDASTLPRHAIHDLGDWAAWHGTTWGPDQYRPHNEVSATACPGRHVMNVLRDINLYARTEQPPKISPPAIPPTLRQGAQGADVKTVQKAVMPHDGIYGPQTVEAVKAFQSQHGLTVDGICGAQTWTTILAS
jgi:N-acetylmuramoyl-L-alanine amidase